MSAVERRRARFGTGFQFERVSRAGVPVTWISPIPK
jgi:hypothetical protein